jgi:NADP-dependent 3-hydroxy acid dehydrogenase YdfG
VTSRVVVITGASSGIGAAIAKKLGDKGDSLVLGARREQLLAQVARDSGSRAVAVRTDVTKREDIEHLRDVAIREFGGIDVWINDAGWGTGKKVMELQDSDVQAMVDVIIKAAIYGMQAVVPHFEERGKGHLINVSSMLGRVPFTTYRSIYSACKSALNVLTANLRMDLAGYPGIHVSLVLPGIVDTDFHRVAGTPMRFKAGEKVGNAVVLSAEQVAEQVANLIDNPVPELYIPSSGAEFAKQYYQDVGAFESRMAQR